MNMNFLRKLPFPIDVKKEYPITDELIKIKEKRDKEISDVFFGKSEKFILVIGPCSADNSEAVLDYISRLKAVSDEVKDKIIVIPRIYTNKPRTTGAGYKGMLHQPDPEQNPDMLKGIVAIRQLHMNALKLYGFTCADEMLYPENHRYLSDLLAYVAIGARSVENQQHRLTASGLNIPAGMKNPTGGDMHVMLNSIMAARNGHTFIYRGWEVQSQGNPMAHAILRGYVDFAGKCVSNYHYEDLLNLNQLYYENSIDNPAAIVDVNHANSGKQYLEQIRIAEDVIHSRNSNNDIKKLVKGIMIESYIEDGNQPIGGHIYGKSITDPCLGWEKTEKLIYKLADTIK